jgi:sugar phosphate isomerase/epimerase
MINRREFVTGLAAVGLTSNLSANDHGSRINVGLELYSLREDMKRDVQGTLARVRQMGFDHVEVPNLYGLTALEFRRALDRAGLKATAMVASYKDLQTSLSNVQRDLEALGARWALLGWIPHDKEFGRADAERSSRDMNAWGAALAGSGHTFAYHPHGYEFHPSPEGTLFDVMAASTDPKTVKFELDTFWIVWPGQDCVKLMKRYPTRFRLLHLKDLRRGVKTGDLSGHAPVTDSVVLGEGIVPWNDVLAVARELNFEDYYIEDESPDAAQQIPLSLHFLRKMNVI